MMKLAFTTVCTTHAASETPAFRATSLHSPATDCHIFEMGRRLEESAAPRAMTVTASRGGSPRDALGVLTMPVRLCQYMIATLDGLTSVLTLSHLFGTPHAMDGLASSGDIDVIASLIVPAISLAAAAGLAAVRCTFVETDRFLPPRGAPQSVAAPRR